MQTIIAPGVICLFCLPWVQIKQGHDMKIGPALSHLLFAITVGIIDPLDEKMPLQETTNVRHIVPFALFELRG